MYNFFSDYYDKEIDIDEEDLQTLIDIYLKIMESQGVDPDVTCVEDVNDDTIDTILYHIENFGQDYPEFENIKNQFSGYIND